MAVEVVLPSGGLAAEKLPNLMALELSKSPSSVRVAGRGVVSNSIADFNELFKRAAVFEEKHGGEDLVTLQSIMSCGSLFSVSDGSGGTTAVMGLTYGRENDVFIYPFHAVGGDSGRSSVRLLLEKVVRQAEEDGKNKVCFVGKYSSEVCGVLLEEGFRETKRVRDYYSKGEDLVRYDKFLGGEPKSVVESPVNQEDEVCNIRLKDRLRECSVCRLRSKESIMQAVELGNKTYPETSEQFETISAIAEMGGLYGLKDENGKLLSSMPILSTKDKSRIYFHGVTKNPSDEYRGQDKALLVSVKKLFPEARTMFNDNFPNTWLYNLNLMTSTGAEVKGISDRPLTEIEEKNPCYVVEWNTKKIADEEYVAPGVVKSVSQRALYGAGFLAAGVSLLSYLGVEVPDFVSSIQAATSRGLDTTTVVTAVLTFGGFVLTTTGTGRSIGNVFSRA